MAKQLLEAIAYLQLIGVAHRCARPATSSLPIFGSLEFLTGFLAVCSDVKLENILLAESSPHSLCKLCDFGLATSVAQAKGYDGRSGYRAIQHRGDSTSHCSLCVPYRYSIKSCQAIVNEGYFGTLATMAPEVIWSPNATLHPNRHPTLTL